MQSHEQSEENDDTNWDELDREYEEFLQEVYGGKVPTLEELARDVRLLRLERQQRPEYN